MKVTFIQPSLGRIPGQRFIRSWQMEPLSIATLAALTPADVGVAFHDDRMEEIPFDAPADLVAVTVETYTAKRAYQIATEYRRRGVPVVMGGFHATLVPTEVARFAESVVIGEAEETWPEVVDDFRRGRPQRFYHRRKAARGAVTLPDRSIYADRNYLKVALVETGRGCSHHCDFCSIQSFFRSTRSYRDIDSIVQEIAGLKAKHRLFFLVDDNITASRDEASELFRALIPLRIRWISQAGLDAATDDELLSLMRRSGCEGILIGIESLRGENLRDMNKGFHRAAEGIDRALANVLRHGIKLYPTFVFGYDHDSLEDFQEAVDFCRRHRSFVAAFNHLVPFPGTPLYRRLEREGRLLYQRWWLDERYSFGQVPFHSRIDPRIIERRCFKARQHFYGASSILDRSLSRTNCGSPLSLISYFALNWLLRKESHQRYGYPLGDLAHEGGLIETPDAGELRAAGRLHEQEVFR